MTRFKKLVEIENDDTILELKAALKRAQQAEAKAKNRSEAIVAAVYQAAADALKSTPQL